MGGRGLGLAASLPCYWPLSSLAVRAGITNQTVPFPDEKAPLAGGLRTGLADRGARDSISFAPRHLSVQANSAA